MLHIRRFTEQVTEQDVLEVKISRFWQWGEVYTGYWGHPRKESPHLRALPRGRGHLERPVGVSWEEKGMKVVPERENGR